MDHFVTTVSLIGIVIIVASLLSGLLERSGLPLVAVFLLLGAVLGDPGMGVVDIGFDSPALRVLATLGLALVLFSDAVTLEIRELRARSGLLWRLLGPGTLAPAVIIACASHWLLAFSWPASAILGAALSSTDPVVLRALLRSKAVPELPQTALRLETGMNDVVLLPIVVLSMLALGAAPHGEPIVSVTPSDVTRSLLGLFVLGPALGALIGWVGISLLTQVRSHIGVRRDYESLYALGLAFTGYAAAESVGGSGFLAAFSAGLVINSRDVELCDCFLEYGEATAEMFLLLTFVAFGTGLMWTGFAVVGARTLIFAVVALSARTIVLYPVLRVTTDSTRDCQLIALFGARGLSSLLLVLLPVFAGIEGAQEMFSVTALVVLISVAIHGGGIALFLRANRREARRDVRRSPIILAGDEPQLPKVESPEFITLEELKTMRANGEAVVVVDARARRSYDADPFDAVGAVRINPEEPVRDATEMRLSQRATLVVFCA